jgi:hypothetical protein
MDGSSPKFKDSEVAANLSRCNLGFCESGRDLDFKNNEMKSGNFINIFITHIVKEIAFVL